jgi:hypothetical protein
MKALIRTVTAIFMFFAFCFVSYAGDEVMISGTVQSINLNANTVGLVTYEGEYVPVAVEDELTLGKLRDRRIRIGDDVKVKYIKKDGKNLSTFFRKTAGC